MADTRALESIADLLPEEKRERFFSTVVKFRNVPENDAYLQLLEATGFIMLVLKEIPDELSRVLDKIRHGMSEDQQRAIRDDMKAILEASIDTPSYKDLRDVVAAMKAERDAFQTQAGQLLGQLRRLNQRGGNGARAFAGMMGGIAAGAVIAAALLALVSKPWRELRERLPTPLPAGAKSPAETLVEHGYIDYFEDDSPEHGGKVGIVVYSGKVLSAQEEAGMGIIVTRPLDVELGTP